ESLHDGGIEEADARHPVGGQTRLQHPAQRATQPGPDRDAKALLATEENRRWQDALERALENVLRRPTAELEAGRDAAGQVDEVVVQERRADLEPACHARAVDVHEVLIGEIKLAVLVDQPVDRMARCGFMDHAASVWADGGRRPIQRAARSARNVGYPQNSSSPPSPLSVTPTERRAKRDSAYVGRNELSTRGSSSRPPTSSRRASISWGENTVSSCSAPQCCAISRADGRSSKVASGNPIVNVLRGRRPFARAASATIAPESIPPLRNM